MATPKKLRYEKTHICCAGRNSRPYSSAQIAKVRPSFCVFPTTIWASPLPLLRYFEFSLYKKTEINYNFLNFQSNFIIHEKIFLLCFLLNKIMNFALLTRFRGPLPGFPRAFDSTTFLRSCGLSSVANVQVQPVAQLPPVSNSSFRPSQFPRSLPGRCSCSFFWSILPQCILTCQRKIWLI